MSIVVWHASTTDTNMASICILTNVSCLASCFAFLLVLQHTPQPVGRDNFDDHQQADAPDSHKLVVIVKKRDGIGRRGLLQEVVEDTPPPADLLASGNVTGNMTGNMTAVTCPLDIEGFMGQALDLKV